MNKIDLNGRSSVVTGGAQGFGRAIAERFVASGAKVAKYRSPSVAAKASTTSSAADRTSDSDGVDGVL